MQIVYLIRDLHPEYVKNPYNSIIKVLYWPKSSFWGFSIKSYGKNRNELFGQPNNYGASLVAQMVKNLPATWETWVQSLSWEDPLEEEMAVHSSILAWRIPMDRGSWWVTVY